jgi:low affinity Fe/Cu permease
VTFWMVFVIQNSQNRASKAVQLKLDEVIRALDGAENKFIRLAAAREGVLAEREAEMDVVAVDTAGSGHPAAAARSSPGPGRQARHQRRPRRTPSAIDPPYRARS